MRKFQNKNKLTFRQTLKKSLHLKRLFIRYKRGFIIIAIASMFAAIFDALVPFFLGNIVDNIINPSFIFHIFNLTIKGVFLFLGLWIIAKILSDIITWKLKKMIGVIGETAESTYVHEGFASILRLPMSYIKNHPIGEMIDRISRASQNVFIVFSDIIADLLPQFMTVIFALFFMLKVSNFLTVIVICILALYMFILFKITPNLATLRRKGNIGYGKAYSHGYDVVANISSVKQSVSEEYESSKLKRIFIEKGAKPFIEYYKLWQTNQFYYRIIVLVAQIFVLAYSIFLIWDGKITIGQMLMYNTYMGMLFAPFSGLVNKWQTLQNALISIERAEKIFAEEPEDYIPENAVNLKEIKGKIKFENVSFKYSTKDPAVLDNISFEINPGEIVAIVGESGVGKSTLADLISNYYQPQSGKIYIDDVENSRIDLGFLRKNIAIVPQELMLFNDTIKTNIRYGSFTSSEKEIISASKKAFSHDFIMKFKNKYRQIVGDRGVKLSGGQKQRVAIARAILKDPRILILDEPTSALDAKSEKEVVAALEILMKGRTTFIIAHRLSTVRKADRIIVLEKGRVVEEGKHEDLIKIKNGAYRKFYEVQKM